MTGTEGFFLEVAFAVVFTGWFHQWVSTKVNDAIRHYSVRHRAGRSDIRHRKTRRMMAR